MYHLTTIAVGIGHIIEILHSKKQPYNEFLPHKLATSYLDVRSKYLSICFIVLKHCFITVSHSSYKCNKAVF